MLGGRGHEIIPPGPGEDEELFGHLGANDMRPRILGTGLTGAGAIKTGHGRGAANLQCISKDIPGYSHNLHPCKIPFLRSKSGRDGDPGLRSLPQVLLLTLHFPLAHGHAVDKSEDV